jgi:hypothetical protein
MFFNDVAREHEEESVVVVPEPLKRVRVLPPFMVAHEGTQYFPNGVAVVPASIADDWLLNQWVVSESSEEVEQPPVARKRR